MTREEAKQNLIKIRDRLIEWYGINNDGLETFRLAIAALEQPESNVARDIATIMENEKDLRVMLHPGKRGRWINVVKNPHVGAFLYKCSECGDRCYEMPVLEDGEPVFDYCPNCGSFNREGGKE